MEGTQAHWQAGRQAEKTRLDLGPPVEVYRTHTVDSLLRRALASV